MNLPAVGGGTITTCHESGTGQPAQQFRTRSGAGSTIKRTKEEILR
jgi:hypothetical protein